MPDNGFNVQEAIASAMGEVNTGNVPPDPSSPPPAQAQTPPPAQGQNPPPPATAPPQAQPPAAPDPMAVERQRFAQEKETWAREKAELARWSEYQTFANENPAWRDHLQETWARRQELSQMPLDPNDPVQARLANVEGQLAKATQTLQEYSQHQAEQRVISENAQYQDGLKAFKDAHPELSLDERSPETGKSREMLALEFAKQHKIEHLPIKDILTLALHSEIVARTEEKARLAVTTQTQQQRRAGIVPAQTQPPGIPREIPVLKGGSYEATTEYLINSLLQPGA